MITLCMIRKTKVYLTSEIQGKIGLNDTFFIQHSFFHVFEHVTGQWPSIGIILLLYLQYIFIRFIHLMPITNRMNAEYFRITK